MFEDLIQRKTEFFSDNIEHLSKDDILNVYKNSLNSGNKSFLYEEEFFLHPISKPKIMKTDNSDKILISDNIETLYLSIEDLNQIKGVDNLLKIINFKLNKIIYKLNGEELDKFQKELLNIVSKNSFIETFILSLYILIYKYDSYINLSLLNDLKIENNPLYKALDSVNKEYIHINGSVIWLDYLKNFDL